MLRLTTVLCGFAALPAYADIDTTTGSDFGNAAAFGSPNSATYGQTFRVAPGDGTLTGFSMFLRRRYEGSGPLMLRGYIASWDGAKADQVFYTSTTRTMNATGAVQEFVFDTDLQVQAGFLYVAFLSVSELGAQPRSGFGMPLTSNEIPGNFVFLNSSRNFASLFTTAWEQYGTEDVWFKAQFDRAPGSAVPEPATWALMVGGLGAAGLAVRRRRRTALA